VPRFSPIQAPFRDRHFLGRLSGERMRIASLAMITVGLAPCLAVPGASQICAGSTSFTRAPLQVSGSAEVTTHAHSFASDLPWAAPRRSSVSALERPILMLSMRRHSTSPRGEGMSCRSINGEVSSYARSWRWGTALDRTALLTATTPKQTLRRRCGWATLRWSRDTFA